MTKEELKQEAEEYAERKIKEYGSTYLDCTPSQFEKYLCNEYLSIIEPREKRIAELEAQIEKMKSDVMANIKWADKNCDNMQQKLVKMWNQWEIKEND